RTGARASRTSGRTASDDCSVDEDFQRGAPMKSFRTGAELDAATKTADIFRQSSDPVEKRLESFPKYIRRQDLKRFLAMYELFKIALTVKGSIVECGVFRGFSLMTWAKLSAILEP